MYKKTFDQEIKKIYTTTDEVILQYPTIVLASPYTVSLASREIIEFVASVHQSMFSRLNGFAECSKEQQPPLPVCGVCLCGCNQWANAVNRTDRCGRLAFNADTGLDRKSAHPVELTLPEQLAHSAVDLHLESWKYPAIKAIPAIYGGSALYMVV